MLYEMHAKVSLNISTKVQCISNAICALQQAMTGNRITHATLPRGSDPITCTFFSHTFSIRHREIVGKR